MEMAVPDGIPGSGEPDPCAVDRAAWIRRLEGALHTFTPQLFASVSLAAIVESATDIAVKTFKSATHRAEAAGQMMKELELAIGEIARSGGQAGALMREASDETRRVRDLVDSHGHVVAKTVASAEQTQAMAAEVTSASEKILRFGREIRSITDQTGMLALNASIEAARAGEHGRGFNVVAQSVKELANQTRAASESVDAAADELVRLAAGMKREIAELRHTLEELRNDFGTVRAASEETLGRVQDAEQALGAIAAAVEEQNAVASSLNGELGEIVCELGTAGSRVEALTKVQNQIL